MLSKGTKLCFEKKTTMLKGLTLIQGSRSLSPILTPRDALAWSPLRERTYPTGSRSRATTAAPRGGHPAQHTSTYPRPTGSRSREPTAAPRGARPAPRSRTSPIPRTPVCARPLSTWRYPPSAAPMHVSSSYARLLSRAHFITSRCLEGPIAAAQHVDSSHGVSFARKSFNSSRCPPLASASQRYTRCDRRPPRSRRFTALKHPKLRKPNHHRRHRVAHRVAHRWEPCEIGGVVEILRSQNVRDDDVVEKAGNGIARVRRVSIEALALSLVRASFHAGRHGGGCRVRDVVR